MPETPTIYPSEPSVVEVVLGVQFSRLLSLSSGHYGLFWKALGETWKPGTDAPILHDQFEEFDHPRWFTSQKQAISIVEVEFPNRFVIENATSDRLVQIQPTRLHLNWIKRDGIYPGFQQLCEEFTVLIDKLKGFSNQHQLGEILPNQWEITYIDTFPYKDYCWQDPSDWSNVLPGLFGNLFPCDKTTLQLDYRAAEWSYEIKPAKGRLRISARPGRWGNSQENELILHMTARGPIDRDVLDGIKLGHEVITKSFQSVVDPRILASWGNKQ